MIEFKRRPLEFAQKHFVKKTVKQALEDIQASEGGWYKHKMYLCWLLKGKPFGKRILKDLKNLRTTPEHCSSWWYGRAERIEILTNYYNSL